MGDRIVIVFALAFICIGCGRHEEAASVAGKPATTSLAQSPKPLPPEALQVRWKVLNAPREIQAESILSLAVTFTNAGSVPWPDNVMGDPQKKDGSYAVRLAYWWARVGEPVSPRNNSGRVNLPRPVAPAETMTVPMEIRAPTKPGEYQLVIEMVQELVQWFSDAGADWLTIPIRVLPPAAAVQRPQP